jgi:hypothetical protein
MSTPENQTPAADAATPPPPAETPAAPRAPRRTKSTTKRAASPTARPTAKRSAPTTSRKPATQPAARARTTKETVMSTPDNNETQHEKLYEESYAQAESLRAKGVEFGRQIAELSLDVTEKAVHQGADLYLKVVEQVPVPFVHEVAKVQADWTVKATDLFVRQGRQLVQK